MKNKYIVYAFVLIIILLLISILINTEGFGATSPGTMVQLNSSHVPNEEDEED